MVFNPLSTHREFQKFIIVGRSRSGSNFLRGLLNDHDQITVFGELFQNIQAFDWAMPGYEQTAQDLEMIRTRPVRFIDTRVFGKVPKSTKALGFKIFYYHAQDGPWEPVWPHLHRMQDLKVVHIKRKNILRTHLSRKRAVLTDQWVDTSGSSDRERPIPLSYEECLEDFTQTRQWETAFAAHFSDHQMVDVYYEDLATDYAPIIRNLHTFLGVDPRPAKPQTYKQSQLPLSQAIENFEDLRARFKNSQWEVFFEE